MKQNNITSIPAFIEKYNQHPTVIAGGEKLHFNSKKEWAVNMLIHDMTLVLLRLRFVAFHSRDPLPEHLDCDFKPLRLGTCDVCASIGDGVIPNGDSNCDLNLGRVRFNISAPRGRSAFQMCAPSCDLQVS